MTSGGRGQRRASAAGARFNRLKLIGMVHLPPLPGSPRSSQSVEAVLNRARSEAELLAGAGFDALIVENFGDAPFAAESVPPETVAVMAVIVDHVVRAVDIPVGVNVLRNDAVSALAVAAATGASFIRVNVLSGVLATDQGMVAGRAHELLRRRAAISANVKIAADVHVKHAVPISQPDIILAAEETAHRAGADALIVSGTGTGAATDLATAKRVAEAVPDRPLWIGSGVTAQTVRDYLEVASAVIVGTALKRGNRTTMPLDAGKVRAFVSAARSQPRTRGK